MRTDFIFLMCSERSGSNLIARMLDAHREICAPLPKHLFNPLLRNLFRRGDLGEESTWHGLLADVARLLAVDFAPWAARFSVEGLRAFAEPGDVTGLLARIYVTEAAAHGKTRVFVKENQIYEFALFLMLHFPDARYVYQVRDPRDMALSWKKSAIHPAGVVAGARQWRQDQVQFLKLHHELQRSGRVHLHRYEDLIRDPHAVLDVLARFVDVPFDERMLAFHGVQAAACQAGREAAWSNLSREVMSGNSGTFAAELTELELAAIEKICYHEMALFGYEPVNRPDQLAAVSEADINELDRSEQDAIGRVLTDGVRANMAAKARFYRAVPPRPLTGAPTRPIASEEAS